MTTEDPTKEQELVAGRTYYSLRYTYEEDALLKVLVVPVAVNTIRADGTALTTATDGTRGHYWPRQLGSSAKEILMRYLASVDQMIENAKKELQEYEEQQCCLLTRLGEEDV